MKLKAARTKLRFDIVQKEALTPISAQAVQVELLQPTVWAHCSLSNIQSCFLQGNLPFATLDTQENLQLMPKHSHHCIMPKNIPISSSLFTPLWPQLSCLHSVLGWDD